MKRNFKSILCTALAVVMLMSIFIPCVSAASATIPSGQDRRVISTDKWTITVTDEKKMEAYIKAFTPLAIDENGTLKFPKTVEGYSIYGIVDGMNIAKSERDKIKKIIFQDNIECIDVANEDIDGYYDGFIEGNFCGFGKLTQVVFSDSMTVIPELCFCNCPKLEKVKFPVNVSEIGRLTFSGTAISGRITLGKDTKVNPGAFSYCPNIKGFKVDEENPYHYYSGGVLYNKDKTQIICYLAAKASKSFKVPYSVTDFCGGHRGLNRCLICSDNLENIEFQANITEVYNDYHNCLEDLLSYCKSLKQITFRNPYCVIGKVYLHYLVEERLKANGFTVYGYDGSTAETFAKDNGFKFVSLGKIPNKVFNFEVSRVYSKTVKCKWHKVSGAEKYVVYKSTTNGETWKKAAETKECSVTLENLSSKKGYVFKVCAVVNGKERTTSVPGYKKVG